MIAATVTDILIVAPVAFLLGLALGLGLSSRYRIVRHRDSENGKPPW